MTSTTVGIGGIDLGLTLGPLAALAADPTIRVAPGLVERATWTPHGAAALRATWTPGGDEARVQTFGDGAEWLLERAAGLLGTLDDPTGFAPEVPAVRALWRRHSGDRVTRTGTVWHDLAWTVVQQRVSRRDAARQWRDLVTAFGQPAPGLDGLRTPPPPAALARAGYAALHAYGIERRRAQTLVAAAGVASRLQQLVDRPAQEASTALLSVPGVGPWTASCLSAFTWGDADTLIVGDDGIPSMVAWLLAGERRADDARMVELLEPYRPHRYRIVRLAFAAGARPPRTAPRGHPNHIYRR